MSDEVKQEVVVPQETITAINAEIKQADDKAVSEAVKVVEDKTTKSLAELRAELEAAKEATRKIAEEQERQRIEAELAVEKAKLEEANKPRSRAVVPEAQNPVAFPQATSVQPTNIPIEQQWAQLDALAMSGGFRSGSLRKY